jgi:glycosyltransferase involved in cell wall biosynthesis
MGAILKPTLTAVFAVLLIGTLHPQTTETPRANRSGQRHEAPQRPRARVELPAEVSGGKAIHVSAGDSLQAALDAAMPGDRITLDPRAVYQGPFRLPRKDGDGWIVVTTAAAAKLPARGQRVSPEHAAVMPRLTATGDQVIEAMPGAHHYRLVGLEIAPADGTYVNTLVQLGDNERTVDEQPHHIVIERSYLHGDPAKGGRRGVALNSRHTAVVDSYLSDFKEGSVDTQAIGGWNGVGPFRIENNYLEAAGENVMFGGADPSVHNLVPADIEVLRNHMAKPLRWKKGHPSYEGTEWAVKNLFELKNARRVLIEGNVLEYNWPHAQNGFAILFTVRNQDGGAPWSVVEDVTFANNIVRHVAAGINILGRDDNHPSQQTRRIAIHNNLFLDVGGQWGNGRLFQLLDGTNSVSVDHNTALQTGSVLFGGDHAPHTGFVFQHNVMPHNEHGVTGSGTDPGTASLARYFPGAIVRGNVFVGGKAGQYPPGNEFAGSLEDAGLAALRTGDLEAIASRPARAGRDGRIAGVDLAALIKSVDGVAPLDSASNASVGAALPSDLSNDRSAGGAVAILWISLGLIFYIYAGYPAVAAIKARLRTRVVRPACIEPTVTIVVTAYNEAARIEQRIENLLALDYPPGLVDIVIASDGSTDGTVEKARRYEALGVTVCAFPQRRGKPAVLNAVVPSARGEIVLLADARQRFEPGTVRALLANFADPRVGAVSGELMIEAPAGAAAAGHGAAFYWRYEKFIRAAESRADSTIGATGAVYAIRRDLFAPIPADTLLDDVVVPMRIVGRGYRVIFEPAARAFDQPSSSAQQEFARKARTIAGCFQLFARERWLLNPLRNRVWFATISHKGLRLTLPVLHLALLAANMAVAHRWPYQWLLAGQVLFYGAAAAGAAQRGGRHRFVGFTVPYTLCLLCWATVVGFARYLTHRQPVTWERPATEEAPTAGVAA